MMYAIELLFDPKTQKHVQTMIRNFHRRKISSNMLLSRSLPHITLSVCRSCRPGEIKEILDEFAAGTKTFPVRFTKIGTFSGTNVVFLFPDQGRFYPLQKKFLERAKGRWKGVLEHYSPRNITFHCTVGIGLKEEKMVPGVRLVKKMGIPKGVQVTAVALYAVPDRKVPRVRRLFSFPLG